MDPLYSIVIFAVQSNLEHFLGHTVHFSTKFLYNKTLLERYPEEQKALYTPRPFGITCHYEEYQRPKHLECLDE